MRFFIVDDDEVVRSMLAEIIEDEGFGQIVGEAEDGSLVDESRLTIQKIDILLIDLMMPQRDGLETVRNLLHFQGKIIMISQIESKDMIGEAYSLGIQYYITKPINRLEVCGVLQRVCEQVKLEKSISDIRKSLFALDNGQPPSENPFTEKGILPAGQYLLTDLGMISESGSKDLLAILHFLYQWEKEKPLETDFPLLKDLLYQVARKNSGQETSPQSIHREVKAMEQRIRRAIEQSLSHLASIGLTDYANPKFEKYAPKFFDFTEIRKKMNLLQNPSINHSPRIRINMKKFIQVLYFEAKRSIQS